MKTTCLVCKAQASTRGEHRCSPGTIADLYLGQMLNGRRFPRSRAAVLALARAAWLEGFGECEVLRKLGLLKEASAFVDYVLRFRPVAEGGPIKGARLPRRVSI